MSAGEWKPRKLTPAHSRSQRHETKTPFDYGRVKQYLCTYPACECKHVCEVSFAMITEHKEQK